MGLNELISVYLLQKIRKNHLRIKKLTNRNFVNRGVKERVKVAASEDYQLCLFVILRWRILAADYVSPSTLRNLTENGDRAPSICVDIVKIEVIESYVLHALIEIIVPSSMDDQVFRYERSSMSVSRSRWSSLRIKLSHTEANRSIYRLFVIGFLTRQVLDVPLIMGVYKIKVVLWLMASI